MRTRDLVHIALFAALTAALGLVPPFPIPAIGVPITAQSMGVMLAGSVLGARRGGLALLLFLGLVAIGMPVLAGGNGGIGAFLTPASGFLLAWPLSAFAVGALARRSAGSQPRFLPVFIANLAGGIGVMYAIGVPWITMRTGVPLSAAAAGSALFIPGDVVKAVLAAGVATNLRRARVIP